MSNNIEIDNHKRIHHPKRVAEWISQEDCYSVYVEVGLANNCNHRCSFCVLGFIVGEEKNEYI